ncbi:hypothetical protein ACFWBH_24805 [Streptomyces sp. NPDC059999]|uniref:hypothetical protein n=1 Tax=Streptomyces sp. NPDC059999 TaxID=3347030 RepID=UPI0036C0F5EA
MPLAGRARAEGHEAGGVQRGRDGGGVDDPVGDDLVDVQAPGDLDVDLGEVDAAVGGGDGVGGEVTAVAERAVGLGEAGSAVDQAGVQQRVGALERDGLVGEAAADVVQAALFGRAGTAVVGVVLGVHRLGTGGERGDDDGVATVGRCPVPALLPVGGDAGRAGGEAVQVAGADVVGGQAAAGAQEDLVADAGAVVGLLDDQRFGLGQEPVRALVRGSIGRR